MIAVNPPTPNEVFQQRGWLRYGLWPNTIPNTNVYD